MSLWQEFFSKWCLILLGVSNWILEIPEKSSEGWAGKRVVGWQDPGAGRVSSWCQSYLDRSERWVWGNSREKIKQTKEKTGSILTDVFISPERILIKQVKCAGYRKLENSLDWVWKSLCHHCRGRTSPSCGLLPTSCLSLHGFKGWENSVNNSEHLHVFTDGRLGLSALCRKCISKHLWKMGWRGKFVLVQAIFDIYVRGKACTDVKFFCTRVNVGFNSIFPLK